MPGEPVGNRLLSYCATAGSEVVLIAPFVKEWVLRLMLERINEDVDIRLVTRWKVEEVAAGVSDVGCWDAIKEIPKASLLLCPPLHAKYYRFDGVAVVGSANLTGKALGWVAPPNLEFVVENEPALAFEQEVVDCSVLCREEMARAMEEEAAEFGRTWGLEDLPGGVDNYDVRLGWLPRTRQPSDLFIGYSGEGELLSAGSRAAVQDDLSALGLPAGLDEDAFRVTVRMCLLKHPLIVELDEYLLTGRRFGEVTGWLDQRIPQEIESEDLWQILMRWLLYFAPDRYERSRPHHTEVFRRVR